MPTITTKELFGTQKRTISTEELFAKPIETKVPVQTPRQSVLSKIGRFAITPLAPKEALTSPMGKTMLDIASITQPALQRMPGLPPELSGELRGQTLSGMTTPLDLALTFNAPKLLSKLPRIMGKNYTIKRAATLADDVKDLRRGIGMLKEEALKQVGDRTVKQASFMNLPKVAIKKLSDPIYGIKKTGKVFEPTVRNLDRIKDALGDLISDPQWVEATKMDKRIIKQVYGQITNAIKEVAPEMTPALEAYHGFMKDVYRPVIKTLLKGGKVTEKSLRSVMTKGGERATQQAFEALGQMAGTSQQALKDIGKFIGRQQSKKVLGYAVGGGAGAYALHRWLTDKLLQGRQYK